jgi:AcrR family transcriptional regulator
MTTPSTSAASDELTAADGRTPGRRGRATRERLLAATADLLATRSYREVKVVDIARAAGSSPATFYQYFADVEAAIVVLAQRAVEDGRSLVEAVTDVDWRGRAASTAAEALVTAFLGFWHDHAAVMRVIDLAIVEGDRRFRDLRNDLLGPVTEALANGVAERRGGDADPRSEAAALVSMLAHVSEHQAGLDQWGADLGSVRDVMAAHVHWGVTGRKPVR